MHVTGKLWKLASGVTCKRKIYDIEYGIWVSFDCSASDFIMYSLVWSIYTLDHLKAVSLRYACWPTKTDFRKVVLDTIKTFCIFHTSFFYWMNCKKTKSWKIKLNSYSWPHSCWHCLFELFSSQNNSLLWAQLWKLHGFSTYNHRYLTQTYQSIMYSLLLINNIY